MVGFLTKDPLKHPVDWTRRLVTCHGETQMKFAVYIQPETTCPVPSSFPFEKLPAELQLHIFKLCNEATLFQLMHVSSTIRHEAQKLFWGSRDTWYRVSGEWLLGGGFAGHTYDDVNFLANVQQVELVFESMDGSFAYDWFDGRRRLALEPTDSPSWMRKVDEQICDVWQLLQAKCPQLTRVLVSETHLRENTASLHPRLVKILEACPVSISIFGASYFRPIQENSRVVQRCLWQKPNGQAAGDWILVDAGWVHECILLPPKDFRGSVGAFEYPFYRFRCTLDYRNALQQLEIEAIERYYFLEQQSPFVCPMFRCGAFFDQPGQWPLHAAEQSHGCGLKMNFIPEIAARVVPRLEKADDGVRDNRRIMQKLVAEWGAKGTKERRMAEDAFLQQLETDPLFARSVTARDSAIWQIYQCDMNHARQPFKHYQYATTR